MNNKYLIVIITVIVVLLGASGYAYYYFGPRAEAIKEEQKKQAEERRQKEIAELIKKDNWVTQHLVNRMPEAMEKMRSGMIAIQSGDESGWESFDEGLNILKSEIERIENAPPPPGKELEELHKELLGVLSGIATSFENWSKDYKAGLTNADVRLLPMYSAKMDELIQKAADLKNDWRYRLKQLGENPNYYEGPDADY